MKLVIQGVPQTRTQIGDTSVQQEDSNVKQEAKQYNNKPTMGSGNSTPAKVKPTNLRKLGQSAQIRQNN